MDDIPTISREVNLILTPLQITSNVPTSLNDCTGGILTPHQKTNFMLERYYFFKMEQEKDETIVEEGDNKISKTVTREQYEKYKPVSKIICYCCGLGDHIKPKCPNLNAICHNCGIKGHLQKVCRRNRGKKEYIRKIDVPENERESFEDWEFPEESREKFEVKLLIDKIYIKFLIDTGSAVSILNIEDVYRLKIPLTKTDIILKSYNNVMINIKGLLRGFKASLAVKSNPQFQCMKSRPIPFAWKAKLETELQRLKSMGVLERLKYSNIASPIVPVLKKDGFLRICGDFRQTVNANILIDKYPLPRINELLDTLEAPILTHYNPEKPIILAADASQHGIGSVISHIINNEEKPIGYASRTLNAAERNYSQIERTKKNSNADMLSRFPIYGKPSAWEELDINLIVSDAPQFISALDIKAHTRNDPVLSKVSRYLTTGWPKIIEENLKPFFQRRNELTMEAGCILWGLRTIIPKKLQVNILSFLHMGHQGYTKTKLLAQENVWWPNINEDIELHGKNCELCQTNNPGNKTIIGKWPSANKPWGRIHLDFAEPINGDIYLVIIVLVNGLKYKK
ncbi:uncharacterized protein LOC135924214 [Gordionus sp. m RMFG-2023]|uniref:uncharacterized protein LOC135924214 n=1 Tax=Gordionus sp. m RMFG-2023 TaxID=3053472 RepID=UPI0031FC2DB8